ncbi:hypothetical protein [Pseudomonas sp. 10S4]|uniref:hypothetical protein n=1 Tax=Pseudomonas sp. 10S4 TaxID=3048583 RepID=UPI002AC9332F|nr:MULTISPECIES: hypothetical protein [unclassified Pseudomonas]MEB0222988.1 hypothetical protein [Pseudomonas sp. 5S1]MEB0293606.1 hypothetical protein [Pseudomonas sp. 10S4]WPX17288.1 hypothetical protein RHM58_25755 [Pseudomonas sp. 10S4]
MFTKTGNSFLTQKKYAAEIARALQMELGETHQATKTLMRWTNADERTVKNWMAGSNGPRGEHLVALVKHSDFALAALLGMAERPQALTASELPLLRQNLQMAIDRIDSCMCRAQT